VVETSVRHKKERKEVKCVVSEEVVKELADFHSKAVELTDKWFPETEKYPRDKRLTIITIMGYMIELERLILERAKGMRETIELMKR